MTARFTKWMVTCFDLENWAVPDEHENFRFCVYQPEKCPDTGALHIQGYLVLNRQTNLSTVKTMFPCEVHLDAARGTHEQCIAYCTKTESRYAEPIFFGKNPCEKNKAGHREDLKSAALKILGHKSWADVVKDEELFPVMARHGKWCEQIWNSRSQTPGIPDITLRMWQKEVLEILEGPPKKREIIWIWSSESGTGKTTFFDYCSSKFKVLPGADFTNTLYVYDGHDIIWFDRTRAESIDDKSIDTFYRDLERWSNHSLHTSTKYVPTSKLVKCHIVVTANSTNDEFRLPDRVRLFHAELV